MNYQLPIYNEQNDVLLYVTTVHDVVGVVINEGYTRVTAVWADGTYFTNVNGQQIIP